VTDAVIYGPAEGIGIFFQTADNLHCRAHIFSARINIITIFINVRCKVRLNFLLYKENGLDFDDSFDHISCECGERN